MEIDPIEKGDLTRPICYNRPKKFERKEVAFMAIIPQKQLFSWKEIEKLGDLSRLDLVLRYIPDEHLMRALECQRGNGRDDYPVRGVWNSILAAVVYQHDSIEGLRRELSRNAQLRQVCGFDIFKGDDAVPPSYVYTRFLRKLMEQADMIDEMFDLLVEQLQQELDDFGKVLAIDGKPIRTHARPRRKSGAKKRRDGRRDTDADFGRKTYHERREDGTLFERVKKWFGYKLHLVVDAIYELPVAYSVTRASASETPEAHKLLEKIESRHEGVLERCEVFCGDKGFDDGKFIAKLYDDHRIKPVIDIRQMWKEPDETRLVTGTRNVVYDGEGNVYCHCMKTGERTAMAYGGFEKDRGTLKYRCPAEHYGMSCEGKSRCHVKGSVRIKLDQDRRIFTPVARSSYKWGNLYKKRSAVERVNSRLDVSFGFERHFIRGLKKMRLRCSLAFLVMLSMALGRVKEKQKEKMRSLVQAA